MLRILIVTFIGILFTGSSLAQTVNGTLDRIAETGEFRIGFVADAPPLSFLDESGNAVGYSIDLCRHIASSIRNDLGLNKIDLQFVKLVSMEERLSAIEDGLVDIECGATTVTLSRRERVDFTLMTFITGGAVLSTKERAITTLEDLDGIKIAVVGGTTTEDVIREFGTVNGLEIKLLLVDTHDEGMKLLNTKKVKGYASDRAMLLGQVFRGENSTKQYTMMRKALSFEPYALMMQRGDTDFRLSADRALASLFRSPQIRRLYNKWFGRYGEPLSPIVEAMYQFQAVGE